MDDKLTTCILEHYSHARIGCYVSLVQNRKRDYFECLCPVSSSYGVGTTISDCDPDIANLVRYCNLFHSTWFMLSHSLHLTIHILTSVSLSTNWEASASIRHYYRRLFYVLITLHYITSFIPHQYDLHPPYFILSLRPAATSTSHTHTHMIKSYKLHYITRATLFQNFKYKMAPYFDNRRSTRLLSIWLARSEVCESNILESVSATMFCIQRTWQTSNLSADILTTHRPIFRNLKRTTTTGLGCKFLVWSLHALCIYGISLFRIKLPVILSHIWRKHNVLVRSKFRKHTQCVVGPRYALRQDHLQSGTTGISL